MGRGTRVRMIGLLNTLADAPINRASTCTREFVLIESTFSRKQILKTPQLHCVLDGYKFVQAGDILFVISELSCGSGLWWLRDPLERPGSPQ